MFTMQHWIDIAKDRGGFCLSKRYTRSSAKLQWQCSEGHKWKASRHSVKRGAWCSICSGNKKLTIQDMRRLASSRGGKCKSRKYINQNTPLKWECQNGHTWESKPQNVKSVQTNWCPVCAGRLKKTLKDMQTAASQRGGRCLSSSYVSARTLMKWCCKKNHVFQMRYNSVQQGQWCPQCAGTSKKSLSDMVRLARSRGGSCLSQSYTNAFTKLHWKCKDGHEWWAQPGAVSWGSWCPHCRINYGEEICRLYLEAAFQASFPRAHPEFLRLPNGRKMQLDGLNESLGVAFEHQGIQHYQYISAFHKSVKRFTAIREKDSLKRSLCRKAGVKLIIVPAVPELTSMDKLPHLLDTQLKRLRLTAPRNITTLNIDINKVFNISRLNEVRRAAKKHKGKCLSKYYLGDRIKLQFECANLHVFFSAPGQVKQGSWCPHCSKNVPLTIADMHALATARQGKCLSKSYRGNHLHLRWECKLGHSWTASPSDVRGSKNKRGSWCPICADRRRHTIAQMQVLAAKHKGKCLSKVYKRNNHKLLWECRKGHRWKAIPNSISNGTWCPECGKNRKVSKLKQYWGERRNSSASAAIS